MPHPLTPKHPIPPWEKSPFISSSNINKKCSRQKSPWETISINKLSVISPMGNHRHIFCGIPQELSPPFSMPCSMRKTRKTIPAAGRIDPPRSRRPPARRPPGRALFKFWSWMDEWCIHVMVQMMVNRMVNMMANKNVKVFVFPH